MQEPLGAVQNLWRFPVKSMLGERLLTAEITADGMLGDRVYGLIELETGKVLSGKTPKIGRSLLACQAEYVEPPKGDGEVPPVRIALPDGRVVNSDAPDCDAILSTFLGRGVRLSTSVPAEFTIDQYSPDLDDLDPRGDAGTVTEQKLGPALAEEIGLPAVGADAFFDLFPVSVLTTSTLDRLGSLRPESRFDERRFRMNVVIDSRTEGFVENGWLGRSVLIGDALRLTVVMPDPRCVMTTLAQEDLPADKEILRALIKHNSLDVAGGMNPCAGVYAVVETPGTVRTRDDVVLG
jgi:uncharacterized protein YcbX